MTVEERRRRRFSKEFRKEQVQLMESGKITIHEVSRLYEVKVQSVQRWLDRFGTKEYPPQIIISSSKEINRLKDLEKENRRLKEIIGNQQLELEIQKGLLHIATENEQKDFEKK